MSGPSNNASRQAQREEQARQARIAGTQGAVNNVFNDPQRAKDISDFVAATRAYGTRELDEQKGVNDRQLKFALARGGQVGGSLQRDKQSEFGRQYGKGLLKVDQQAQAAGSGLESADQDARARLIQQATNGIDITTAAQQAAAAMRTNIEAAKPAAQLQGIGDIFGPMQKYFQSTADAAVRRKADYNAGWLYGGGGYGGDA